MTRYVTVLVIAGLMSTPANALPKEQMEKQCRYQGLEKGTWTDREERRTAACVVDAFGVVGGLSHLLATGECESSWYRFARNGDYAGIFQHDLDYWYRRVVSMMPEPWKVGPWTRWQNPRSQIVVTVRMVNEAGGWSAWSCY